MAQNSLRRSGELRTLIDRMKEDMFE